ncbi:MULTISPECIES: hypothetical protein [unclassified Variovorax]|uniref:hypothetical protein n=1 Tax=unclassified Variovorax TaxID=663243 RepID=UPI001BD29618|nr:MULTISPECIES: hypothetical protein [unclassified Variovorax]
MKKTVLLLAAAAITALSGCVAVPYDAGYSRAEPPPHARGRGDRDRDGDGVPNRYDRAPDNPAYR